jgi:hypothetical protein
MNSAWRLSLAFLALVAASVACDSPTAEPGTGLHGLATLGPVTPVCLPDPPCVRPVAGTFEVRQGTQFLKNFRSDSKGVYTVHLSPGSYRIVPTPGSPIPFPESQVFLVTVDHGPGLTIQDLPYSTFLR